MAAAVAADRGVPTVFISGDDKITSEVAAKIAGIEVAEVKQALSPYMACSLIPARACELIYQGVCRGIQRRAQIAPYKIPGPVTLTLLDSANHCLPFTELCPAQTCANAMPHSHEAKPPPLLTATATTASSCHTHARSCFQCQPFGPGNALAVAHVAAATRHRRCPAGR